MQTTLNFLHCLSQVKVNNFLRKLYLLQMGRQLKPLYFLKRGIFYRTNLYIARYGAYIEAQNLCKLTHLEPQYAHARAQKVGWWMGQSERSSEAILARTSTTTTTTTTTHPAEEDGEEGLSCCCCSAAAVAAAASLCEGCNGRIGLYWEEGEGVRVRRVGEWGVDRDRGEGGMIARWNLSAQNFPTRDLSNTYQS